MRLPVTRALPTAQQTQDVLQPLTFLLHRLPVAAMLHSFQTDQLLSLCVPGRFFCLHCRWRKLEGSDPSTYEMIQKIQTLQKRLIGRTEEVVEKDLLIQVSQSALQCSCGSIRAMHVAAHVAPCKAHTMAVSGMLAGQGLNLFAAVLGCPPL